MVNGWIQSWGRNVGRGAALGALLALAGCSDESMAGGETSVNDGTDAAGAAGTGAGTGVPGVPGVPSTPGTPPVTPTPTTPPTPPTPGTPPVTPDPGTPPTPPTTPPAPPTPPTPTTPPAPPAPPPITPPTGDGCLQGSGDYTADGPYGTARFDVSIGSQGMYTVFHPMPLDSDCLHPIVAWGNGTGVTGSAVYAFYQEHAASWGMVVVAAHNSNTGSGAFHRAGLDYLLEQNDDPNSMFYGKLSPRAGTSGHSQGGAGANAGASHPNVEAIVNVQGSFGRAPAGKAFLCLTGTEDISPAGCKRAVDGTSSPAMHANYQGADHVGTATLAGFIGNDPGTRQYMRLYSAWFRCFLADDGTACALFEGGMSCPVCQESGWAEIYSNNF